MIDPDMAAVIARRVADVMNADPKVGHSIGGSGDLHGEVDFLVLIARPGSAMGALLREAATGLWRRGADRAVLDLPGGIESHEASDGQIPPVGVPS